MQCGSGGERCIRINQRSCVHNPLSTQSHLTTCYASCHCIKLGGLSQGRGLFITSCRKLENKRMNTQGGQCIGMELLLKDFMRPAHNLKYWCHKLLLVDFPRDESSMHL